MPLTFIDIERQKSWRIWLFFLVLMLLYLVLAALFGATFFPVTWYAAPRFWVFAGMTALLVAGIHFLFSAYDTVGTVVRSLDAQPPDPRDDIHTMLMNVMQEVHVVTGNKRKMQCVVIPSLSMNALAAADLRGEAVIGVTEGLLSRLNRPQLEAVIAHEAHHILSGDCLETTVAASLFGSYSSAMEKLTDTSRGRTFVFPAFLLTWILLQLSSLLNMCISRQREYRADAAAVRMTRNPIALAETLYLLSRSWRGSGFIGSGFEMLCIVNPQATALDETEGFWADLLSTHPPLSKRIDILLKMARVSITELEVKTANAGTTNTQVPSHPLYYAMSPGQQWQGPFTSGELAALPWLSPLTWITKGKEQPVVRASKEPAINDIFRSRLSEQEYPLSNLSCPSCRQPLIAKSYEGTQLYQCRFCAGILVDSDKIPRIIARAGRERPCSERINSLAKAVVQENQRRQLYRKSGSSKPAIPLLACPKCSNPMFRGFYSQAHLIAIDRCSFCGVTWFDQDELEMLQCLIENRITPDITGPDHVVAPALGSSTQRTFT
jgi:heat shock protein HtpX